MSQEKRVNFSLPEFVFLDANCHTGNALENRAVFQHIRSYTVLEAFYEKDFIELHLNPEVKCVKFSFVNGFGIEETHILAVHFTFADDDEIPEILEKCRDWFIDYMRWEDRNIKEDAQAKIN
jgi:hypothetical protein